LPDALFVAVRLSGIDVPIPELERPTDSVNAFAAVVDLPDTEAQHWDRIPVGELKRSFVTS
jgi:hypothetical protein